MASIIAGYNRKVLHTYPNPGLRKYNCRKKTECPTPGKRTSRNLVYEATVSSPTAIKKCIGMTASSFKVRYASHKNSFNDSERGTQIELRK